MTLHFDEKFTRKHLTWTYKCVYFGIKSLWSNCNFWIKGLSYLAYPVWLTPLPQIRNLPVWPPLQVVSTYSIVPFDKLLILYTCTCMYYIFHCSLKQSHYTIIWFILLSVHCHIVNQIIHFHIKWIFCSGSWLERSKLLH